MFDGISVGLDVHARSVAGCGLNPVTGEVFTARFTGEYSPVVAWVQGLPGPARVVYEAGPTGYGLARAFIQAGIECVVAAPSKLVGRPGDKVKTDRRDARHLAEVLSMGLVPAVRIPGERQEAVRDVLRARDDARQDLMRARQRLSKLLLRHGVVYPGKTTWNTVHLGWLRGLEFDQPPVRTAFDNDLAAVLEVQARRDDLDHRIRQLLADSDFQPVVTALSCLRGVDEVTGFGLAVEIGDWSRFTGGSVASFVGLVPSEHSSGQSRSQGGVTKTGNGHARRLLVEAAWHHRGAYHPARSVALQARWAKADPLVRRRADQANRRLHAQWVKFDARGKRSVVANCAVARELVGFCWSLATMT